MDEEFIKSRKGERKEMGEILIDITPEQWEALKKSETITIETKNPIPVESGSEVICYILNTGIVGKFEVKDAGHLITRAPLNKINPKPGTLIEFDHSFPIETANPLRKSCNIAEEGWCEIKKYTRNKVAYSMDGENYSGMFDTAAEALEDARNEIEYMIESRKKGYKIDLPERVFVGECELYQPSLLSCGYDVIEAVQDDAYDEAEEYAEDYLDDVTKEQREELEEQLDVVFNAWLEKYDLYPNFYTIPAYDTYKYIDGEFEREEE